MSILVEIIDKQEWPLEESPPDKSPKKEEKGKVWRHKMYISSCHGVVS